MVIGLGLSMWLWLNNQALLQLALGPLSQKLGSRAHHILRILHWAGAGNKLTTV